MRSRSNAEIVSKMRGWNAGSKRVDGRTGKRGARRLIGEVTPNGNATRLVCSVSQRQLRIAGVQKEKE